MMVLGEGPSDAIVTSHIDGRHQRSFQEDQSCLLLPSVEGWPDERLTP